MPNYGLTQPLPALSVVYIHRSKTPLQLPDSSLTEQGERLGETHVWKALGGAVRSITNIYSLGAAVYSIGSAYRRCKWISA